MRSFQLRARQVALDSETLQDFSAKTLEVALEERAWANPTEPSQVKELYRQFRKAQDPGVRRAYQILLNLETKKEEKGGSYARLVALGGAGMWC